MGFEALMQFIPAIATGLGAGLEYGGNQSAAAAARVAAQRHAVAQQFQAEQLRVNAGQQVAAAQHDAAEQGRQATLLASRAQALAAASGGGALDPGVVKIISNIAGEGQHRAAVALYQGEERARAMRMSASAADYNASLAISDGELKADAFERAGTAALFKGAGSLFSKYGSGGFKADPKVEPNAGKSGGNVDVPRYEWGSV